MNNTVQQWLKNRVTLLTDKSTAELREIGEEINSRAFYVAKLTVANITNELKEISDDYVSKRISLSEAQEKIKHLASGSPDEIARSLMRYSRSKQVLNNQRQLARGVAKFKSWQDSKDTHPYIIYHANDDGWVRPSHKALDGKVFSVDDPFLHTHMPGQWDYNCRCWGEPATIEKAKAAGAKTGGIQSPQAPTYDAESGFMFNPANAFMPDASTLKDKNGFIQSIAESVRHGAIQKIGMIVTAPGQKFSRSSLTGLSKMTSEMKKLQPIAENSVRKANWDYKKQPSFIKQAEAFKQNNPAEAKKIPEEMKNIFTEEIEIGNISGKCCQEAGFGDDAIPVILDIGGDNDGLVHNWRHHKECFINPAEGERILRATLGNPQSQISVSFEKKGNDFVKIITFFDPKTKSYCVAKYDDKAKKFKLMSWHRSPAYYGEKQMEIRGKINDSGSDKDRKKTYYRQKHDKK